jgi:uncharacterized protein YpmB
MKKLLLILLVVFSICFLSLFAIGCSSSDDTPSEHTHTFANGVCTSCGDKQGTDGLKYAELENGTYSVSMGTLKDATEIIVPKAK